MLGELRYALRAFSKAPALGAIVILALAVGIGAMTAIFSLLNAVVLRPLPYPSSEQLAFIWALHKMFAGLPLNVLGPANADVLALKRGVQALAHAQFQVQAFSLETCGTPTRVSGARVNADFVDTLQVAPTLGRGITAAEDRAGGDKVIVISTALWQRAFNSDPRILEESVRLEGQPYHVIGLRRGLGLTVVGLGVGLLCATASARLIDPPYGITPTDGVTMAAVSLLLIGVAALSCLSPSLSGQQARPCPRLSHRVMRSG